jgi:citrate lyase subunit beta/citryl-CoA lyase
MIRSLLYVPANAPRFVGRAHERGADAIILDLEDSVVPNDKDAARFALAEAVPAVGRNGAKVFVRINSEPERLEADAEAACLAGAWGLLVPKARAPQALQHLAARLDIWESAAGRERMRLVPILEDPNAVLDARIIALATPRILAMATGGEDLATEMDAEPSAETLRLPRMLVHLAAKAARIMSFGLMRSIADYSDLEGIAANAREARSLGFDGASCVHPSVVPVLNQAFSPSDMEVDRAKRLIAAFETAGVGAVSFEGKMVDLPIVERARRLLSKIE